MALETTTFGSSPDTDADAVFSEMFCNNNFPCFVPTEAQGLTDSAGRPQVIEGSINVHHHGDNTHSQTSFQSIMSDYPWS